MKICKLLVATIVVSFVSINHGSAQFVKLDSVCFSTKFDDYGVRRFGNDLTVVSANQPDANGMISLDDISGKPFSDVYLLNNCNFEELLILSKEMNLWTSINSSLNDSPISSNSKGDLLFLSNNSGSRKNKLKIFYTRKVEGYWLTPKEIPANGKDFNTTHPFYDESSDRLYFASDRKESFGGYDIFYVPFNDGSFGKVKQVEHINSPYSEVFPFVQNGTLYFTSNNPENSFGALDLFFLDEDQVVNLGEPFNSPFDDLAIMFDTDSTGYFSTNRFSRGQKDDVKFFQIFQEEPEFPTVEETKEDVAESEPVSSPHKGNEQKSEEEKLDLDEEIKTSYQKEIDKEEISEDPIVEKEVTKTEIPDKIVISDNESHVNFAFDKYVIKEDFHEMLNDIAVVSKDNPDLFILISGHTDNIGSREYNLKLSEKRAQEVKKYLVMRGVNSVKIIVEYHAFDKPVASNETEEGRAKNRRTEVSFLGKVNPR